MHRIVSLLPSATEIVCALGFTEQLVGRSHECDYPHSITSLPSLTAPKFDAEGTSAQIDDPATQIVGDALSVYRVDTDAAARRLRGMDRSADGRGQLDARTGRDGRRRESVRRRGPALAVDEIRRARSERSRHH